MKHAAAVLVTAAVLALVGCGSPGQSPPAAAPPTTAEATTAVPAKKVSATASDVMFVQMLVSQERATATLLATAKGKSVSADTRNLTGAISATQADEARRMVAWLRERNEATSADAEPSVHTAHGGTTALTAADFTQLRRARGQDFEIGLLNTLLGQQHNAVELARNALAETGDPWVKNLAQQVNRSRTAEIRVILKMVAAGPSV